MKYLTNLSVVFVGFVMVISLTSTDLTLKSLLSIIYYLIKYCKVSHTGKEIFYYRSCVFSTIIFVDQITKYVYRSLHTLSDRYMPLISL